SGRFYPALARGPLESCVPPSVSAAVPVFVSRRRFPGDGPRGRVGPAALEFAPPPGLAGLAGGTCQAAATGAPEIRTCGLFLLRLDCFVWFPGAAVVSAD
ncbi:hypothetical protein NDU88_010519, partial [Pleurodeles waltl]